MTTKNQPKLPMPKEDKQICFLPHMQNGMHTSNHDET